MERLWAQFRVDARASYRLYSEGVDSDRRQGESHIHRSFRIARAVFWAMLMKLSPARRILLLVALVLLLLPGARFQAGDFVVELPNLVAWSALILLLLLALELADRVTLKRDLEIAREIQGWLMPNTPPQIPGVDIAFATRPANTVAGDYYDVFQRGDRILLVVADVAGKSIPAALLMATLQASLRTLAALPGSLVELVERLNRYACEQNVGGHRFTTAFIAELEPASGRLTYVNSGHNWPVLQRSTGSVERLQAGGLPLGIRPDTAYESAAAILNPGDILLVFTDGLVEAEDTGEQEYGEGRMLEIARGLSGARAADALRRIMGSVEAFVGPARQHDDITCLLVTRSAGAGVAA